MSCCAHIYDSWVRTPTASSFPLIYLLEGLQGSHDWWSAHTRSHIHNFKFTKPCLPVSRTIFCIWLYQRLIWPWSNFLVNHSYRLLLNQWYRILENLRMSLSDRHFLSRCPTQKIMVGPRFKHIDCQHCMREVWSHSMKIIVSSGWMVWGLLVCWPQCP